jgi:hypothetical protein
LRGGKPVCCVSMLPFFGEADSLGVLFLRRALW